MFDSSAPLPCVLFALRRESTPFLQLCSRRRRISGAPQRTWLADFPTGPGLVLETGLGTAAMEKALGWLVNSPFRPALVLLAGFSGALTEDLHPADLVLGTEIANNTGETFRLDWPSQKSLFRQGRLLTWPKLVGDPEEKRRLGRDFAAVAVDMESATAARVCRQHQVPFGCLRAISDCLETPLSPRLVDLLQGGRVAPLRLARAFLTHPSLIGETWRLARDTRLAAQSLARGIAELLRGSSSEENG